MGSNPKYKELFSFTWEDNKYWTSFFGKLLVGSVAISLIFAIIGSFVSIYGGLILAILPIGIALLGSYFLLKFLTIVETYYVSDDELLVQFIRLGKMENIVHHRDNIDSIMVLVNGDNLDNSTQEFFFWEFNDPTTKIENLIFKSSPDMNAKSSIFRQGLADIGIKVVDFYYEGIGICNTCVTMPAKYEKDSETNCPQCENRIRYY